MNLCASFSRFIDKRTHATTGINSPHAKTVPACLRSSPCSPSHPPRAAEPRGRCRCWYCLPPRALQPRPALYIGQWPLPHPTKEHSRTSATWHDRKLVKPPLGPLRTHSPWRYRYFATFGRLLGASFTNTCTRLFHALASHTFSTHEKQI